MTPLTTILTAAPSALPPGLCRAVRVCWTSRSCMNGHGERRLMLDVELRSTHHATVEAWLESGNRASDRRCIMERQTLPVEISVDDLMQHIDVFGSEGNRIAAISVLSFGETLSDRPLYAQTTLLSQAGFLAGGYDSPRNHRIP